MRKKEPKKRKKEKRTIIIKFNDLCCIMKLVVQWYADFIYDWRSVCSYIRKHSCLIYEQRKPNIFSNICKPEIRFLSKHEAKCSPTEEWQKKMFERMVVCLSLKHLGIFDQSQEKHVPTENQWICRTIHFPSLFSAKQIENP